MVHSVQLIVGRSDAVAAFVRRWPGSRAVDLRDGWQAIPVDQSLQEAVEARYPGAVRPPELDGSPLGLEQAMAAATEDGGGLAYVETEYFGGTGEQSAMAFADGVERMAPQRSRGGGGPINQALRAIGVVRSEGVDEFDTVGLGERRKMEDYEPEGPVRLRAAPEAKPAVEKAYVPLWRVLLVLAAVIAFALFVAVPR